MAPHPDSQTSRTDSEHPLVAAGARANLCLHDVSDAGDSVYTLSQAYVTELADRLTDAGAADAVRFYFDDGYRSLTEIVPLLRSRYSQIELVLALVTDWVGQPRFVSWGEVRELLALGAHAAPHSLDHPWLSKAMPDEAVRQMRGSRMALEDALGDRSWAGAGSSRTGYPATGTSGSGTLRLDEFVLPYGDYDQSLVALNAERGLFDHMTTVDYAWDRGQALRPRLMVTTELTAAEVCQTLTRPSLAPVCSRNQGR